MGTYCMGIECSVKNTCLRYTKGRDATIYNECGDKFIRKCTQQKRYLQDQNNVNVDGANHR